MKAISLWQPWASAMMVKRHGSDELRLKRFETRSWAPPEALVGQRMAIASAKTVVGWEKMPDGSKTRIDLRELWADRIASHVVLGYAFENAGFMGFEDLHFGVIVGFGTLHRVVPTEVLIANGEIDDLELNMGNYSSGRFGWEFAGIVPLEMPVPVIGRQGLFDWDTSTATPEVQRKLF